MCIYNHIYIYIYCFKLIIEPSFLGNFVFTASKNDREEIFVSNCPKKYLSHKIHLNIDNNDLILKQEHQKIKSVDIQERRKLKNWRKHKREVTEMYFLKQKYAYK